jgi:ribulose-bisphosphate carboxylase large chain
MSERIYASYWLETGGDPAQAAEIIAGEQSSGTFVALPNETPELKAKYGARVERLELLDKSKTPSLPTPVTVKTYSRCVLELSWSLENMGTCLPTLWATIAGNLTELRCVTGLRLLDVCLPPAFAKAYKGPQFGIEGTRRLANVYNAPLIGTIIKPSVGLNPTQTAQNVKELIEGGIDFIKDDELQADGNHCPFEERVIKVMREVRHNAEHTGKKAMVAFNLTGSLEQMKRRHDAVVREQGTCIMVCLNSIGFVGLEALRAHSQLPIHGHRAGWGYLSRHPALGFDYAPLQQFWRLLGADHLHVNGLDNKFSESNESVITSAKAVLRPLFQDNPMFALPVFSSGQTVAQAKPTFQALGSKDLIHTAGGGIFGHPQGIKAGVEALRESWEGI